MTYLGGIGSLGRAPLWFIFYSIFPLHRYMVAWATRLASTLASPLQDPRFATADILSYLCTQLAIRDHPLIVIVSLK